MIRAAALGLTLAACAAPAAPPDAPSGPAAQPSPTSVAPWLPEDAPPALHPLAATHVLLAHADSVPPGPRSPADARATAERLWLEAARGTPLDALASAWSDAPERARGGHLGTFTPGTFEPRFEAAVASAPPGDLAPLVETRRGVHVVRRDPPAERCLTWVGYGPHRPPDTSRALAAAAAALLRAGHPLRGLPCDTCGPPEGVWVGPKGLPPALDAAAWALSEGGVSPVLPTPAGAFVLYRPPTGPPPPAPRAGGCP